MRELAHAARQKKWRSGSVEERSRLRPYCSNHQQTILRRQRYSDGKSTRELARDIELRIEAMGHPTFRKATVQERLGEHFISICMILRLFQRADRLLALLRFGFH